MTNWKGVYEVSAGDFSVVGVATDGSASAVGDNTYGESNVNNTDGWSDIVEVSVGSTHTIGLKKDGTVVTAGKDYDGQCDVSNWDNISTQKVN